jgi:hypothetical protein
MVLEISGSAFCEPEIADYILLREKTGTSRHWPFPPICSNSRFLFFMNGHPI